MRIYPTKSFIESEIRRTGVKTATTSSHIMIPCPFHRETHPSLSISLGSKKVPPGVWFCFGCQEKGTWNKLAKSLGLRIYGEEQEDNIYITRNYTEIKEEIRKDKFRLSKWDKNWRKYSVDFLKKFNVKKMTDKMNGVEYMYIPVEYGGDTFGYIRTRLRKNDPGPKYFFAPNMEKVLYPFDILLKQDTPTIVLVEGIADAFRLIKYKIPALAMLGVVLTPLMLEQLELLGVKNIILCLDGDKAGRQAVNGSILNGKKKKGLKSILKNLGYKITVVNLPEGTDPDNVSLKCIKKIRDLLIHKSGKIFSF